MKRKLQQWMDRGKYFTYQGKRIFYIREGKGPTLLIIHGYPYSSYEWLEMVNKLSQSYSVVIFDLLGMGFSDKPQAHIYSFKEHADIVNSLLAYLNVSETHILSHDLGVSIVQELIARDVEGQIDFAIKSSAFLNGGLFMDVYKPRLIQRLLSQSPTWIGKVLSKAISKKTICKSVREVYGKNTQPSDQFLDEQWDVLNYNDGKAIAYLIGRLVFEKKNHQNRWIKSMQKTTIPVCFINGPADPNSGIHMANRYTTLIPNPKVFLLGSEIGHWPHLENPNGVLKSYEEFKSNLHQ